MSPDHAHCSLCTLLRVTQVYLAIDDRLTSLKTDTFSKTREEKMEDLFAQKDVGFSHSLCVCLISAYSGAPRLITAILCVLDGRGRAAELD